MLAQTVNNTDAWVAVAISWGLTAGVLGGFSAYVLRKGRELSKRVPEDRRRWM
ncbi:MAG: hypothetical protein GX868_11040 [Actinobacteria bacterium]|nr:hypothetical protein [Actinomycetota bacterium]